MAKTKPRPFPSNYIDACRVADQRKLTEEEGRAHDRMMDEHWDLQVALRAGAQAMHEQAFALRDSSEETTDPNLFDDAEEELRQAERFDRFAARLLRDHDQRARAHIAYKRWKATRP